MIFRSKCNKIKIMYCKKCNNTRIGSYNGYTLSPNGILSGNQS